MPAINKGGYLVLNGFEISYFTMPSTIRHLQGGVCVIFGIGVERDSLATKFQVGAALDDKSQYCENSDQRFKGLRPCNFRRTIALSRMTPLTLDIIGIVCNA